MYTKSDIIRKVLIWTLVLCFIELNQVALAKNITLQLNSVTNVTISDGRVKSFVVKHLDYFLPISLTIFPQEGKELGNVEFALAPSMADKIPSELLCQVTKYYQTCFFSPELLLPYQGKSIYIQAHCIKGPCRFDMASRQNRTHKFIEYGKEQVQFDQSEIEVFQFQFPSKFEFRENENNRVIIDINFFLISNPEQISKYNAETIGCQPFKQDVVGDRIILTYIPVTSQGAKSNNQCSEGQTFTLILISHQNQSATIDFYSFKQIEDVEVNKQYVDFIKANSENEYKVNFKPTFKYDYLKLSAQFPKKISTPLLIYMNSDTRPMEPSKFYWSASYTPTIDTEHQEAEDDYSKIYSVAITRDQLEDIDADGARFYIQMYAEESGFLDFQIESETFENAMIDFGVGEIVSGKIGLDDTTKFVFEYPSSVDDIKILFKTIYGNATMQVRKCPNNDCDSIYDSNLQDYEVLTQLEDDVEEVKFKPFCQGAQMCQFLISVIGCDSYSTSYQMEMIHLTEDRLQMNLTDGVPIQQSIKWGEYQFFKFDTMEFVNWTSVQISVTSPDIILYVSTSDLCKYPVPLACQDNLIYTGIQGRPVLTKKSNIDRIVYIAALGSRHTKYSILATVNYKKRMYQQIITAQNGISLQGEITPQVPQDYYEFVIPEGSREDIEVNVRGPKDKLVILAGNKDDTPSLDSYQWISTTNFLFINHTSKEFKKSKSFWIVVAASEHGLKEFEQDEGKQFGYYSILYYSVVISTSSQIKDLTIGEPMYDVVQGLDQQIYQFQIAPKEDTISINRYIYGDQDDTDKIVFYVGSQPAKKPNDWSYRLRGTDQATFMLNKTILEKVCVDKTNTLAETCNLFVCIQNFGIKRVSYTLTVWELSSAIEIKEGYEHQYTLYHINGYMHFYYIPTHRNSSINLYLYSEFGLLNFQVTIFRLASDLPVSFWPFPNQNQQNQNYTSGIYNSHSITFSQDALDECWLPNTQNECRVLISVSFFENNNYDPTVQTLYDDTFKIIVSTRYSELYPGQRMEFVLAHSESRYFYIDLKSVLDSGKSISLQMTQLLGKALISATIRDNKNPRYPDCYNTFDFISSSNYLEITNAQIKQIMKSNSLSTNQQPQLVVEIYSYDGHGEFILNYKNSDSNVIELLHGLPQEFSLAKDQTFYYQFFNYFNSTFQVKVTRSYGFGDLRLTICDDDSSMDDCISAKFDVELHLAGTESTVINIDSENTDLFCSYCYYLISIYGEESEMHGFVNVLLDDDASWLMEGFQLSDFLEPDQTNYYRLSVPTNEEIELQLVAYIGSFSVYVNYIYSLDYSEYTFGPYTSTKNDMFLNIKIPSRDDMMLADENFSPYNPSIPDSSIEIPNASQSNPYNLADHFISSEILVAVVNKGDKPVRGANYTILYMSGELQRQIVDGYIVHSVLEMKEKTTLIYQHYDAETPTILTVEVLTISFPAGLLLVNTQLIESDSTMNPQLLEKQLENIQLQIISIRGSTVIYQLPQKAGAYQIQFTNNGKQNVTFNSYINTKDMTLMPLNQKIEHFLVSNSVNYYEFIAPRSGYLALSMIHCSGNLQMAWSQNYDEFLNKKYQVTTDSFPGHTYIDPIQVHKGALYIVLTTSTQEAYYSLKASFYQKIQDVPQMKLDYGGEGMIKYQRGSGNMATVSFKPLICNNCTKTELRSSIVTYEILWSKDLQMLNVIGKCHTKNYMGQSQQDNPQIVRYSKIIPGDILFRNQVKVSEIRLDLTQDHDIQQQIFLESTQDVYYVTVLATVSNFGKGKDEFEIFYENTEMKPTVKLFIRYTVSNFLYIISYILLVLFFTTGLVLVLRRYYRNKSGQIQKIYHIASPNDFSQNIEVENLENQANPTSNQTLNINDANNANSNKKDSNIIINNENNNGNNNNSSSNNNSNNNNSNSSNKNATVLNVMQTTTQKSSLIDSATQKQATKQGYNQLEEAL